MIPLTDAQIFSCAFLYPKACAGSYYSDSEREQIMRLVILLQKLPVERFIVSYGGVG